MNDKLTEAQALVNDRRGLLSPLNENRKLNEEARLLCEYIDNFVGFVPCDEGCTHEGRAALAIVAIPYFIRNKFCICQKCLSDYSEGDKFLFLALRARVLVETGQSSLKWPHVESENLMS